jgi:prevent-host-death family protein
MAKYRRGDRAKTIPATEAAKNFGELVNRVRETQEVYIVERGGRPVVQVGPVASRRCTVADLVHTLASLGGATPGFADVVERGVRKANRPTVPKNPWPR